MTEEKEQSTGRKSVFESLPSYLAGFAAVATATVAVLTYLHNRDVETTPITEPEVSREHVGAVPSVEVSRTRATQAGNASTKGATQAKPTLDSALHPARCAAYVGTWKLSSGETMSLLENERVEIKAGSAGQPRFGRWSCSGRDDETFSLSLDREPTVVFTASGDGNALYQRGDQHNATPLSAARASGQ